MPQQGLKARSFVVFLSWFMLQECVYQRIPKHYMLPCWKRLRREKQSFQQIQQCNSSCTNFIYTLWNSPCISTTSELKKGFVRFENAITLPTFDKCFFFFCSVFLFLLFMTSATLLTIIFLTISENQPLLSTATLNIYLQR